MINPPQNILAADAGDGTIHVVWDAPDAGDTPDGYDIYVCQAADGTFLKFNPVSATGLFYAIANLQAGVTIYVKMKSVKGDNASNFSSLAAKGTLQKVTGTLVAKGPAGDTVPAGTIFASKVNNNLVAFITSAEVQLSE